LVDNVCFLLKMCVVACVAVFSNIAVEYLVGLYDTLEARKLSNFQLLLLPPPPPPLTSTSPLSTILKLNPV
jgi:hypothetical protein